MTELNEENESLAEKPSAKKKRTKEEVEELQEEIKHWTKLGKELISYAERMDSAARFAGTARCVSSDPAVNITPEKFDWDPWLFNVKNGTINLRTGNLRNHRKEDLITKLSPVEYSLEAVCPLWDQFLLQSMGGDRSKVECLKRVVGYWMTGKTTEQKIFFFIGDGNNGKSVCLNILLKLFGAYGTEMKPEALLDQSFTNGEGPSSELVKLMGARLGSVNELKQGAKLNEALIKQLTGGDQISARQLHKEAMVFTPQCVIVVRSNHRPVFSGGDGGIERRILLFPFTVRIPDDQIDKELVTKLEQELPGILRWAVEGCLEWQRIGLSVPESVSSATKEYIEDMDVVGLFMQHLIDSEGQLEPQQSNPMYEKFKAWAESSGNPCLGVRHFRDRIQAKGWWKKKEHGFNRYYPPVVLEPDQSGGSGGSGGSGSNSDLTYIYPTDANQLSANPSKDYLGFSENNFHNFHSGSGCVAETIENTVFEPSGSSGGSTVEVADSDPSTSTEQADGVWDDDTRPNSDHGGHMTDEEISKILDGYC